MTEPRKSTFRERQADAQYEVIGQLGPEAMAEILAAEELREELSGRPEKAEGEP